MKKFILILIFLLMPLGAFAQFNFNLEDLFLESPENNSDMAIKNIELIWSTGAYVPFGYQGRRLPSYGGKITVEAIVNMSQGDKDGLKYSWFLENIFQRNKSGYGKNEFYFYVNKNAGSHHQVKVQIFNETRTVFEEKTIEIPVVSPELAIFSVNRDSYFSNQHNQILAIFPDKNFSFIARPYFFNINKLTDLEFEWRLSGQEPVISSDYDANVLNLEISGKEEEAVAENQLWVNVKNIKEPKQKVFQSIDLKIY